MTANVLVARKATPVSAITRRKRQSRTPPRLGEAVAGALSSIERVMRTAYRSPEPAVDACRSLSQAASWLGESARALREDALAEAAFSLSEAAKALTAAACRLSRADRSLAEAASSLSCSARELANAAGELMMPQTHLTDLTGESPSTRGSTSSTQPRSHRPEPE